MPTNLEILEAYSNALPDDLDALDALRHPDFVEEWPQSGETIRSKANMRSIQEHYPGTPSQGSTLRVVGSEDRWVVSPSYTVLRIEGTGDVYTCLWRAKYPDDSWWHIVSIIELKDKKVWRACTIFAQDFEAPAWRAGWVERG
jgi:hypothetical protein